MADRISSVEDIPAALAARFGFILGSRVERPENMAECWVWPTLDERGYALVSTYIDGKVIRPRAHRVAYLLLVDGAPLGDRLVRHLCGNEACVRPHHLAAGTQIENMADARRHGTRPIAGVCLVGGCDRKARSLGMCGAHRERVRAYGDPIAWLPIRSKRGGRRLITS
jgi:hypothetical protein